MAPSPWGSPSSPKCLGRLPGGTTPRVGAEGVGKQQGQAAGRAFHGSPASRWPSAPAGQHIVGLEWNRNTDDPEQVGSDCEVCVCVCLPPLSAGLCHLWARLPEPFQKAFVMGAAGNTKDGEPGPVHYHWNGAGLRPGVGLPQATHIMMPLLLRQSWGAGRIGGDRSPAEWPLAEEEDPQSRDDRQKLGGNVVQDRGSGVYAFL